MPGTLAMVSGSMPITDGSLRALLGALHGHGSRMGALLVVVLRGVRERPWPLALQAGHRLPVGDGLAVLLLRRLVGDVQVDERREQPGATRVVGNRRRQRNRQHP